MRKGEYLENIMGREFYDFYRKTRKKPSPRINQYNYFEKAVNGMFIELRKMIQETEYGVHLAGLGVLYKKPFGQYYKKLSIFTHKKMNKKSINFYLENNFLRHQYLITNTQQTKSSDKEFEDKSVAILLHRKLKLKK